MFDGNRIAWLPTLVVNMERGFASGLVGAVVMLLGPESTAGVIVIPFMWMAIGPLFAFALHSVGRLAAAFGDIGQALGGFISLVSLLLVAIGDPILWAISKIDPMLVPIERFGIFNRASILIAHQAPAAP